MMWLFMSLSSGIHGLGLPLGKALGIASPAICGPKEASQIVSSPLLSQGHYDQPWGSPSQIREAKICFSGRPTLLTGKKASGPAEHQESASTSLAYEKGQVHCSHL